MVKRLFTAAKLTHYSRMMIVIIHQLSLMPG